MAYYTTGKTISVCDSFEIKDSLKANGYNFNGLSRSWDKDIASPADLAKEISFLNGLGAMINIEGAWMPQNKDFTQKMVNAICKNTGLGEIKVYKLGIVKGE